MRKLILIGEDTENIESQLKNSAQIVRAASMQDAVQKSFENSQSGDFVLLAPACASFDMFNSFEERGKIFKNSVLEISSKFNVQVSKS